MQLYEKQLGLAGPIALFIALLLTTVIALPPAIAAVIQLSLDD